MSPSRRKRTPARALALLLSVTALGAVAYALAQRGASAARATQASPSAEQKSRPFVPGEILVRFRGESKAAEARQSVSALRASDGRDIPVAFETPPGLQVVRGLSLARVSPADTLEAVESLRALPDVLYAEPNYIYKPELTPNDPQFTNTAMYGLSKIGAPVAWDTTQGSQSVVVGVIRWATTRTPGRARGTVICS